MATSDAGDLLLIAGAPVTFRIGGGLAPSAGAQLGGEETRNLLLPLLSQEQAQELQRAKSVDLWGILKEATARGYRFDSSRILRRPSRVAIPVTRGQIDYEMEHLKKKLFVRDPNRFRKLLQAETAIPHPIFKIVPGPAATWEVIQR